jgi:hypothetical protein
MDPHGHTEEERQCMGCEREQCQQKMPSPTTLRRTPMMSMVMVPVTEVARVTPSTTATARFQE